jgi:hypothetical protein
MSLFDDASVVITPNGQKAGKLYSIKPTDGSGDLSVTRATSATRVDANGLVEIPRTNLVTYSEEFGNINWTKLALTVTSNTTTSPDGTTNADTLNIGVDASNTRHRLNSTATATQTIGTTYTGTFYLKKASQRWMQIIGNIGYSLGVWANFDLENGVIGNTGGVDTTATIENAGNGWYRCRVSGVATGTSTTGFELLAINNTNGGRYPSYQSLVAESVCFVWGAQTEVGSTATEYIPTVASIRTKFAGITQDGSSASNIPRLDYTNGSCPSILVEPQRTNLALRSEEFDNASWGKSATTVTANATTSPSGNLTAEKLIATAVSSTHFINQQPAGAVNGTTATVSIFAKASELTRIQLVNNGGGLGISNFNLSAGTATLVSGVSASIENYGNGWYRCIMSYIPTITGNYNIQIRLADSSGNTTFLGNAVDGLFIWGAQIEAGANATSYIPTTSASVTRNADVISKTGISSLIGQTEGTLYWEGISQFPTDILGTNRSTANGIYITKGSGNLFRIFIYNSSNLITLTDTIIRNSNTKIAISYKSGNTSLFVNGVKVATSLNSLTFNSSLDAIRLNDDYLIGKNSNFTKSVLVYKTQLTDQECINLTTI